MNKLLIICVIGALLQFACVSYAATGTIQPQILHQELVRLTDHFDGRVGISVQNDSEAVDINGDQPFPLQSVMKLAVGMAVMDRVDDGKWHLDDEVVVHQQDLSLAVQPLAKLVTPDGFHTNIGDLVHRAIINSDSAATDILIARLGGPQQVQAFLVRKGISGVRIDRDEKHLQTEIIGLDWQPEYVDSSLLNRAIDAVPKDHRDAAYKQYQADVRDTATPKGMASLLQSLASEKLLSNTSTKYLLDVMNQTRTFPDRLKAGVSNGWTLAHKTGTSSTWNGVTAATNDVGILTTPDGDRLSIVVFIADSRAPDKKRAELMAQVAAAAIAHYQK
ncbi:MAG TPA: class A beta-lactamase [Tepidisphaeraceae bacterium]|jgi:beta-lactamase class A|nr:class A beta-lactamase [Tepidisphaeraceae bacterium]